MEEEKEFKDYYVGDIIKGHTYFIGDFHDKSKDGLRTNNLGMPKMRLGIILIKKHPYYKVQFQNSSNFNLNLRNEIKYKKYESSEINSIKGKDSYCIWVHVSKIKKFICHSEIQNLTLCLEDIYKKHSKNKKFVEKKIINFDFHSLPLEQKKYFLERKQFMDFEIQNWLTDEKAIQKILLLDQRSKSKNNTTRTNEKICIRILEAGDWIKNKDLITKNLQKIITNATKKINKMKNGE